MHLCIMPLFKCEMNLMHSSYDSTTAIGLRSHCFDTMRIPSIQRYSRNCRRICRGATHHFGRIHKNDINREMNRERKTYEMESLIKQKDLYLKTNRQTV